MMILIDFSQIAYACTIEYLLMTKQKNADIALVRHMMLNTIRVNVKKYKNDYGEVVIAYDSDTYWRKEKFPHYKANRKKSRENSQFNWQSIFTCIDALRKEFRQYLPYKVIEVSGAEADDIIGCLTYEQVLGTQVLILSGDKDFFQLQSANANVTQRSPFVKGDLKDNVSPDVILKDHIIRGDTGDGIPNILSPDDVFVSGGRQKPLHTKKLVEWLTKTPEEFCVDGDMLKNYKRNEELIDLRRIPSHIKESILQAYAEATPASRSEFLTYLVASGLKELTSSVSDF
jgi:hypothetical protein